ncbi:Inclusion body clearance protein iml2 [Fulvia fulva]|uniref:Inclusion body clearance protein IML2 n=1 Tax=Passalora fulva TaxID=5499 RepID=A0A9Q8P2W4_PASFU|nr:Inclusion body clearance protein iml2 [Fulvia fulva]UJO11189.1 Inclusion body clearance protein iml2 [Fulvia fulva]
MAMKRVGGWLNPSKGSLASSKSRTAIDEPHALQEAMRSASLILNDETERAESELAQGTSPFHKLGRATTIFLRATLGFEKEIMEQASSRLADAEESASEHQRRAIRDPSTAHQSKIYPVGAEYALCHAETQLMTAVVGVLNESLTESLRGFYKLRKAFSTLQELVEAENRYLEKHISSSQSSLASSTATSSGVMTPAEDGSDDEDLDFQDAQEGVNGHAQPMPTDYQGHLNLPKVADLKLEDKSKVIPSIEQAPSRAPTTESSDPTRLAKTAHDELDFTSVSRDEIDIFIHSGSALCFGLLQLLLSMVPPAFSKLLSIFSFRGDRENGLRLLWKATAFKDNINGGMAGLITLGFHNAAIALCDIHSREAYPEARIRALLSDMRSLYPKSFMWILEEARMLNADRKLESAVELLTTGSGVSPLKQVEALRVFETSLSLMFLHRYQECADSWIKCVDLNNWSHGLYYYIAGACHVELYRITRDADPTAAAGHKEKAKKLFHTAHSQSGKKRFMARQLPLDVFIQRKFAKWAAKAKAQGRDEVEVIGVSPLEEMIYFWSGFPRMSPEHLQLSWERLSWSDDSKLNPDWKDEPVDERALLSMLKATTLRCLGRLPEAQTLLAEEVFCHDLAQIKACPHADNWSLPVGHYEKGVCHWQEAGGQDGDRAKLQECSNELTLVERWESFELDARIGLKLTTARETLRRIGIGHA